MKTYSYPVSFEPGDDPSVVVATFPDVPQAITEGDGMADARRMAADALGTALLALIRARQPLPVASAGGPVVAPPAAMVAKLAVLEAFAAAGITRTELAARIGRDEKEARRILDPMHPTKLETLEAALAALGQRLVLGVEAAA